MPQASPTAARRGCERDPKGEGSRCCAGRPIWIAPMPIATRIRQLGESVTRATGSLVWYYRTRPDARRYLAAPGLGALLALWFSVAWAAPLGLLLAVGIVVSFILFATPLIEELRSFEAEAAAGVELRDDAVAWLTRLAAEEPSTALTEAEGSEADENSAAGEPIPGVPGFERGERLPTTATRGESAVAPSERATELPPARSVPEEPVYELCEVVAETRLPLEVGPGFLEISDLAFEYIGENDPAKLEIVRVTGEEREIVWSYTRRESPTENERTGLTEVFGFDVSRWSGPPHREAEVSRAKESRTHRF
jgi:hypothetical protein